MRAISSHRDLRYNKMRVLIIAAAVLACAVAAPSHGHYIPLSPLAIPSIQAYAVPAAIPTISPGDIQAAAIDAQVKAADLAQAAIDKARELNEQVAEDLKAKASDSVDINKEQITDVLWATKDKQWQALDQLNTAQAKIDGAVASQADILAKSAVGVVPYVAGIAPIAPVVGYPGFVAPNFKSIASSSLIQTHPETIKVEGVPATIDSAAASGIAGADAAAASLKSAEANAAFDAAAITANTAAAEATDASVKSAAADAASAAAASAAADASVISAAAEATNIAADASVKSAAVDAENAAAANAAAAAKSVEALAKIETESIEKAEIALAAAKAELDKAYVALHAPVIAPGVTLAHGFGYSGVGIAPVPLVQPVLKYANTVYPYGQVLTPTFVKNVW